MLSRSARWSGAGISNGRQRLHSSCSQSRSYSQLLQQRIPRHNASLRRRPRHLASTPSRSISLFGWTPSKSPSDEFATAHADPSSIPPTTNVNESSFIGQPTPVDQPIRAIKASHATSDIPDPSIPIQDTPPFTPEPSVVHSIDNAIALPHSGTPDPVAAQTIPEAIGYLKQIGLDYGWGFTTLNEWVLEHLHLTAGLTWGGSIVALALIFRVAVWPLTSKSSDQSARLQSISPELKPLQTKMKAATERRDQQAMLQVRSEIKDLFARNDVKMYRIFLPILVQIPFQFGAFRLMRGMSSLPVPALESEQFLWMSNLLTSDPYVVLPVLSSAAIYGAIYFGTPEGGPQQQSETMTTEVKRILRVVFPVGNLLFMYFQPGAVQIYFTVTSFLAALQSFLMMNPTSRRILGLYPMPKREPPPPPSAGKVIRTTATTVPEANGDVSFIDKGVEWVKAKGQGQLKSFSRLGDMALGTKEERIKKQQQAATEIHEARRRREIQEEREMKNQSSRQMYAPKEPGVLQLPATPSIPTDTFGEDENAAFVPPDKKGRGRKRFVPRIRQQN